MFGGGHDVYMRYYLQTIDQDRGRARRFYAERRAEAARMNAAYSSTAKAAMNSATAQQRASNMMQAASMKGSIAAQRFGSAWMTTASRVESSGKRISRMGTNLKNMGHAIAPFSAAIIGVGIASVKMSADFRASMTRVHTQATATMGEVRKQSEALLRLSPQLATVPNDLALSLYHVESAGFRSAKALQMVKSAAMGARIGHANLEDVTQAMIATMASEIKGVHGAKDAMAQLNSIVGVGDTKMADFAKAMSSGLMPVAANAGLKLRDVGAALATITDNATPANVTATRLRMSISLLAAPTHAADKALALIGIRGLDIANKMRGPRGMLGAIAMLRDHLKSAGLTASQQQAVITRAFGGGRSSGTIQTLIREYDRLQTKYKQLTPDAERNGKRFADAWKRTQQTTSFQFAKIRAELETTAVRIGDAIGPSLLSVVQDFTHAIIGMVNGFKNLPDWLKKAVTGFGLFLAIGAPVLILLGSTVKAIGSLVKATGWLMGATGSLGSAFMKIRTLLFGYTAAQRAAAMATAETTTAQEAQAAAQMGIVGKAGASGGLFNIIRNRVGGSAAAAGTNLSLWNRQRQGMAMMNRTANYGATFAERQTARAAIASAPARVGFGSALRGSLGASTLLGGVAPVILGASLIDGIIHGIQSKRADFGGKFQDFLHGATFGIVDAAGKSMAQKITEAYTSAINAGLANAAKNAQRGYGEKLLRKTLNQQRQLVEKPGSLFSGPQTAKGTLSQQALQIGSLYQQRDVLTRSALLQNRNMLPAVAAQLGVSAKGLANQRKFSADSSRTIMGALAGRPGGDPAAIGDLNNRISAARQNVASLIKDAPALEAAFAKKGNVAGLKLLKSSLENIPLKAFGKDGNAAAQALKRIDQDAKHASNTLARFTVRNLRAGGAGSIGQIRSDMARATQNMQAQGVTKGTAEFTKEQHQLAEAAVSNVRALDKRGVISHAQAVSEIKRINRELLLSTGSTLSKGTRLSQHGINDMVHAWGEGFKKSKVVSDKQISGMISSLDKMPPKARFAAAQSMIIMSQQLENKGKLVDGTTAGLVRRLGLRFDDLRLAGLKPSGSMRLLHRLMSQLGSPADKMSGAFRRWGKIMDSLGFGKLTDKIKNFLKDGMKPLFDWLNGDKVPGSAKKMIQKVSSYWSDAPKYAKVNSGNARKAWVEEMQFLGNKMATTTGHQHDVAVAQWKSLRDEGKKLSGDTKKNWSADSSNLADNVGKNLQSLLNGFTNTYSKIAKDTSGILSSFGVKSYHWSVSKEVAAAGRSGHARERGGWIGNAWEKGKDKVHALVGRGEAILNRHQQKAVNQQLATSAAMGTGKFSHLGEVFQKITTPHSYAKGGIVGGSHFQRLQATADRVSAKNWPYKWGGGHEQPARFEPFDCSGAVSYATQQAGYNVPTTVSGGMGSWPFPRGGGAATVFYNAVHTFMKIGNRFWGTSGFARPGGGAGWFNQTPGAGYLSGFQRIHLPNLGSTAGLDGKITVPNIKGTPGLLLDAQKGGAKRATAAANAYIQGKIDAMGGGGFGQAGESIKAYTGPLDKRFPRHFVGQGGVRLSPKQVFDLAVKAGLPGRPFEQIAHGESDYYPGVEQRNPGDGNIGYGLWQMTPHAWGSGSSAYKRMMQLGGIGGMFNPWHNALMAKFLYHAAGDTTSPWFGTKYLTSAGRGTHAKGGFAGMPRNFAGWFKNGLKGTFSKPTLIGVGEDGPEDVFVQPKKHARRHQQMADTYNASPGVKSYQSGFGGQFTGSSVLAQISSGASATIIKQSLDALSRKALDGLFKKLLNLEVKLINSGQDDTKAYADVEQALAKASNSLSAKLIRQISGLAKGQVGEGKFKEKLLQLQNVLGRMTIAQLEAREKQAKAGIKPLQRFQDAWAKAQREEEKHLIAQQHALTKAQKHQRAVRRAGQNQTTVAQRHAQAVSRQGQDATTRSHRAHQQAGYTRRAHHYAATHPAHGAAAHKDQLATTRVMARRHAQAHAAISDTAFLEVLNARGSGGKKGSHPLPPMPPDYASQRAADSAKHANRGAQDNRNRVHDAVTQANRAAQDVVDRIRNDMKNTREHIRNASRRQRGQQAAALRRLNQVLAAVQRAIIDAIQRGADMVDVNEQRIALRVTRMQRGLRRLNIPADSVAGLNALISAQTDQLGGMKKDADKLRALIKKAQARGQTALVRDLQTRLGTLVDSIDEMGTTIIEEMRQRVAQAAQEGIDTSDFNLQMDQQKQSNQELQDKINHPGFYYDAVGNPINYEDTPQAKLAHAGYLRQTIIPDLQTEIGKIQSAEQVARDQGDPIKLRELQLQEGQKTNELLTAQLDEQTATKEATQNMQQALRAFGGTIGFSYGNQGFTDIGVGT